MDLAGAERLTAVGAAVLFFKQNGQGDVGAVADSQGGPGLAMPAASGVDPEFAHA